MVISKEELEWAEEYFRVLNYLSSASIYLKDNFLLERKLRAGDIKERLVGHWGTCPGINFVYTHLNLLVKKKKQETLLVCGPGHGFAAILANLFLEGSLRKYYPEMSLNKEGAGRLIKSFCWPGGFPSHINPGVPGAIHEGGELGYALGTAFGAVFDNPDLLVAVIVGDGEAETGPTATAWHSAKFLNPSKDGAVLPILHLNGFKISNKTIYGEMSDSELNNLFKGYGYEPIFVGEEHSELALALEKAYQRTQEIKKNASTESETKPIWPMIILKTRKGWTGVKEFNGEKIEGSFRSHQVPLANVKTNVKELNALENWLKSYEVEKAFSGEEVKEGLFRFIPEDKLKIGLNKHALGGNLRGELALPSAREFEVEMKTRGEKMISNIEVLSKYLKKLILMNAKKKNFRVFSPDELASNKLGGLSETGRVMEMLSEHTLQAWMQGYVLTGRHGLFPSYESFMPIVDSMISQYLKFLETSKRYQWRKPVSALNYLLTSVCWRQDHNGFSHQNPGFISTLLNKSREEKLVRLYFPADANMLLAVSEHNLQSTNRINVIVSDKQLIKQWQSFDEAVEQATKGASVWEFASVNNPEIIFVACGDYQTQETLATIKLLRVVMPELRARFVNVSELNVLGKQGVYPNALSNEEFDELFSKNKKVIFSYHGYPNDIKQLLFDRENNERFSVYGYSEKGTTTTPFDLLVKNGVSRYNLAIYALEEFKKINPKLAVKSQECIDKFNEILVRHRKEILEQGADPRWVDEWSWG